MLDFENITCRLGCDIAVKDVSMSIGEGEYISLAGPNGSGKTSLALLAKGILKASSGKISLKGRIRLDGEIENSIAYVFSNPEDHTVSSLVHEDIAFGPENQGLSGGDLKNVIEKAAAAAGITEILNSLTHHLSGGEQQRVVIAGILAMQARIIFFDEAVSMLDPVGRMGFLDLLRKLCREKGITIIHISHRLEDIFHTERVLLMEKGSLIFNGSPGEFLSRPELLAIGGWGNSSFIRFSKRLWEEKIISPGESKDIDTISNSLMAAYFSERRKLGRLTD